MGCCRCNRRGTRLFIKNEFLFRFVFNTVFFRGLDCSRAQYYVLPQTVILIGNNSLIFIYQVVVGALHTLF